MDFAVANMAAVVEKKQARSDGVRLVFGSVAAHPFRSVDPENFLRGKNIEETSAGQVSEVALTNARPLKMNQYKFDLAKTLAKRALFAITS